MNRNSAGGILLPKASQADRDIATVSQGHFTSSAVLGDGQGIRFQAESHGELLNLLVLNANKDITELREQALFKYGADRSKWHYFDAFAVRKDGLRIAYTFKPECKVNRGRRSDPGGLAFIDRMQIITWWVHELRFADDVRLVTEEDLDPVLVHNARVIAAVREPDREADIAASTLVQGMTGARTIRELTVAIGMKERGYRAILRMIRNNYLDFRSAERITPSTLVIRKEKFQ